MDETVSEEIIKSLQEKADIAISRVHYFLEKKNKYVLSLESDLFQTGRMWFIRLGKESSWLTIASIFDANRPAAEQIRKNLSMMFLVMGFSVQQSKEHEFEYDEKDMDLMRRLEKFFTKSNIHITYETNGVTNISHIICENGEEKVNLIEVGGVPEKSISILSKQITLILGGLGKHFSTKDGTIGNKYGVVEFCPREQFTKYNETDDGWPQV